MSSEETRAFAPSELFGASDTFAYAFASFLRQNAEAWRIRRVDRFRPFDLHLAERRTTLQGRISPGLLRQFATLEGLRLDAERTRAGEAMTIYVPVAVHQKRLHIDHNARDRKGHSLPMVNRFESARMTAVHLMVILVGDREIDVGDARRLFIVLMTLAFQTPSALEERIQRDMRVEPPLGGDNLLEWVEWEGDTFIPGLGGPLRGAVERFLARRGEGFLLSEVPSLERYTIEELFVHGIRDVLKAVAGLAPLRPRPQQDRQGEYVRAELMDPTEPDRLATFVERETLPGLELLSNLLSNLLQSADETTLSAFYSELLTWTSYIPLQIELGLPFTVEIGETYRLDDPPSFRKHLVSRFVRGSWQSYPVPLKDADGVHVEIEIPDAALQITDLRFLAEIPGLGPFRIPSNRIFGSVLVSSERMVHLYSSRMRGEAPQDDWFLPLVRVRFRVQLIPTVAVAHGVLAIGALVAASFIAGATFAHAISGTAIPPSDLRVLVAFGSLSLTLGVWLTAIHHPRPITFKTLAIARLFLFIALIVAITGFAAYGISQLVT